MTHDSLPAEVSGYACASDSANLALQVVALVTEGAQRPELPAPKDLPGTGTFAGYSEYIMLMEQCWHQDPAARPTFAQVCAPGPHVVATDVAIRTNC